MKLNFVVDLNLLLLLLFLQVLNQLNLYLLKLIPPSSQVRYYDPWFNVLIHSLGNLKKTSSNVEKRRRAIYLQVSQGNLLVLRCSNLTMPKDLINARSGSDQTCSFDTLCLLLYIPSAPFN